jgi:hypothetical protein
VKEALTERYVVHDVSCQFLHKPICVFKYSFMYPTLQVVTCV